MTDSLAHDLTLDDLIAYLEQQPPQTKYDPTSYEHCVLAEWITACHPEMCRTGQPYFLRSLELHRLFDGRGVSIAYNAPATYGAALERARRADRRAHPLRTAMTYIHRIFTKSNP